VEEVLFYAKDNMTSPCAFHLLSHISDPDAFAKVKSDFAKKFKRALQRQYKSSKQETPDVLLIYSIEFKMTDIDEINDTDDAYKPTEVVKIKLPFLHIHVCVIADCKKTIPQSFNKRAMNALNEIDGLTKARYFKSKDRYISVFDEETRESTKQRVEPQMYKKLKTDFDDVYDRVKYLAKVEQKDSKNIPFRQTFGISRLVKKTTAAKVATA
jgi:hypothetical protein